MGNTTPTPIAGQRDLSEADRALINDVKAEGEVLRAIVARVAAHSDADQRAVAIARTELQTGLMWLLRAIARPTSF